MSKRGHIIIAILLKHQHPNQGINKYLIEGCCNGNIIDGHPTSITTC